MNKNVGNFSFKQMLLKPFQRKSHAPKGPLLDIKDEPNLKPEVVNYPEDEMDFTHLVDAAKQKDVRGNLANNHHFIVQKDKIDKVRGQAVAKSKNQAVEEDRVNFVHNNVEEV